MQVKFMKLEEIQFQCEATQALVNFSIVIAVSILLQLRSVPMQVQNLQKKDVWVGFLQEQRHG
ncbi:hypothetical protein SDC9_201815 [bioreactor metagenome]|uniref:Uncharacterized protein n=1 Tax=bioreactor metagenome TaxID=1076179 RepID=A0A645ISP9_9ZZZZ